MLTSTTRRLSQTLLALAVTAGAIGVATSASAYTYPSSNDANRAAGLPHVNLVSAGIGSVTLEFVNPTDVWACFERRIDGVIVEVRVTHYNPGLEDVVYPFDCIRASSLVRTLTAGEGVETRLAFGGERDWDFDWSPFPALPDAQTRADCKKKGWQTYGFASEKDCNAFVDTGYDPRLGETPPKKPKK